MISMVSKYLHACILIPRIANGCPGVMKYVYVNMFRTTVCRK